MVSQCLSVTLSLFLRNIQQKLISKLITHYQLRPRQHDRQLIPKNTKVYSCNFAIRMLYKHSYWLYFIVHSLTVLITFILLLSYIVQVAFWQLAIKRRWWWRWWWLDDYLCRQNPSRSLAADSAAKVLHRRRQEHRVRWASPGRAGSSKHAR